MSYLEVFAIAFPSLVAIVAPVCGYFYRKSVKKREIRIEVTDEIIRIRKSKYYSQSYIRRHNKRWRDDVQKISRLIKNEEMRLDKIGAIHIQHLPSRSLEPPIFIGSRRRDLLVFGRENFVALCRFFEIANRMNEEFVKLVDNSESILSDEPTQKRKLDRIDRIRASIDVLEKSARALDGEFNEFKDDPELSIPDIKSKKKFSEEEIITILDLYDDGSSNSRNIRSWIEFTQSNSFRALLRKLPRSAFFVFKNEYAPDEHGRFNQGVRGDGELEVVFDEEPSFCIFSTQFEFRPIRGEAFFEYIKNKNFVLLSGEVLNRAWSEFRQRRTSSICIVDKKVLIDTSVEMKNIPSEDRLTDEEKILISERIAHDIFEYYMPSGIAIRRVAANNWF